MGQKAVFHLLFSLFIIFSAGLAAISGLCRYATTVPPASDFWPMLAFITPAVLLLNLLLLLFWLFKRQWWPALIPIVGIAIGGDYLFSMIQQPQFGAAQENQACDIRIATLNVHGFRQTGSVPVTAYGIEQIANQKEVDVICFQEFSAAASFTADSIAARFADRLPYFVNQRSQAILSRYPILAHRYVRFRDTDNDYMWADLKVGEKTVRVISVHLQTSGVAALYRVYRQHYNRQVPLKKLLETLNENNHIRAQQVAEVRALIDTTHTPIILAGDFNDTPSTYTYYKMKQQMTDGFRASGHGYGGTFWPIGNLLRIDYIFYNSPFTSSDYRILDDEVSDHKMVVADLNFRQEQ